MARRNVIVSVMNAKNRGIAKAFYTWKKGPHKAINDPNHIKRVINGLTAWKNIRLKGNDYLIPYIRSNRICLTECGSYIALHGKDFIIYQNGGERFATAVESTKMIQPYIEVNQRGPTYHQWLYNMHHKVKHFMIRK